VVAVWTRQGWPNEPGSEQQSKDERQSCADNREPAYFAPLIAREELLRLGAGKEHEQQQSQPVNEIEDIALMPGALKEAGGPWQASDERIAENNAGQYFADNLWLRHFYEQPAEELSKGNQKLEEKENLRQIRV
jgi:hypothetical protein